MRTRAQKVRQEQEHTRRTRESAQRLTTSLAILLEILDWDQLHAFRACLILARERLFPPLDKDAPLLRRQLRNVEVLGAASTAVATAVRQKAFNSTLSIPRPPPSPSPVPNIPYEEEQGAPNSNSNSKSLSATSASSTTLNDSPSSSPPPPVWAAGGASSPSSPPTNWRS